jgi:hypothetical protein
MLAMSLTVASSLAAGDRTEDAEPGQQAEESAPGENRVSPGVDATRERMDALAKELARTAKQYGADAVALQVALLINTIRAGAVAPSEVTVVGPSGSAGPAYLEITIVSGLIFDADTTSPRVRLERIWNEIAAPALGGMETFATTPASIELKFAYSTQRFAEMAGHRADPNEPYQQRHLRVEIPEDVLSDLAVGTASTDEVLTRSRVYDGERLVPSVPSGEPGAAI